MIIEIESSFVEFRTGFDDKKMIFFKIEIRINFVKHWICLRNQKKTVKNYKH